MLWRFLSCLCGSADDVRRSQEQEQEQMQAVANAEMQEFSVDGNDAETQLTQVSQTTGFPVSFLRNAMSFDAWVSMRTSKTGIHRDSFDEIDEFGNVVIWASHKTPTVGSKSNESIPGHGKVLLDTNHSDRPDTTDDKDNNTPSRFPDGRYEQNENTEELRAYIQQNTNWNIAELRLYKGLVFFKMKVPQYDPEAKVLNPNVQVDKHYCQEAQTFNSIFTYLDMKGDSGYRDAHLVKLEGKTYLQFRDRRKPNSNTYRVNLDALILPATLSNDNKTQQAVEALKTKKIKDLAALRKYLKVNNLGSCHVPLFCRKGSSKSTKYIYTSNGASR